MNHFIYEPNLNYCRRFESKRSISLSIFTIGKFPYKLPTDESKRSFSGNYGHELNANVAKLLTKLKELRQN